MGTLCLVATAPALASPAGERHTGKIVFVEQVTSDIRTAEKFYGRLFGWKFQNIGDGDFEYAQAMLNGQPVAGLIHKARPRDRLRQPSWLTLSTSDVDNPELPVGLKDIPRQGREAVLADAQGAVFAILSSGSGDQPDALPAPGEWIWSSLLTKDPEADADFYQTLFDYDIYDLPSRTDKQHLLLSSDEYAHPGINAMPDENARSHPHWINYVRVENTAKMAEKAVILGGHVLVKPHIDPHGGSIAVIADPAGAPFGIMEWPEVVGSNETPH